MAVKQVPMYWLLLPVVAVPTQPHHCLLSMDHLTVHSLVLGPQMHSCIGAYTQDRMLYGKQAQGSLLRIVLFQRRAGIDQGQGRRRQIPHSRIRLSKPDDLPTTKC